MAKQCTFGGEQIFAVLVVTGTGFGLGSGSKSSKNRTFQIPHLMREHGEESAQRDPSRSVLWRNGISGAFDYAGAPISILTPKSDMDNQ